MSVTSIGREQQERSWNCSICTFENHAAIPVCEMCDSKKPVPTQTVTNLDIKSSSSTSDNDTNKIPILVDAVVNCESVCALLVDLMKQEKMKFGFCNPYPLHISQKQNYGSRWSCGYRNIQMLCSSLVQLPAFSEVLFNKDGKVPMSVNEMQGWIEKSWRDGFDLEGAMEFDLQLVGSMEWIGATECAALLRYFGIRCDIIDFGMSSLTQQYSSLSGSGGRKRARDWWEDSSDDISLDTKPHHKSRSNQQPTSVGQEIGAWLLDYFNDSLDHRFPLYLQHMGHSRTIVGIEKTDDQRQVKNLLIFDPAANTDNIAANILTNNAGWKRQIKRGLHTLHHGQYQMVVVRPTLMTLAEREKSKLIVAANNVHSSLLFDV